MNDYTLVITYDHASTELGPFTKDQADYLAKRLTDSKPATTTQRTIQVVPTTSSSPATANPSSKRVAH